MTLNFTIITINTKGRDVIMFTPQDLIRAASRDYILGNVSLEEQVSFIEDQIADPFGSGDTNHLKRLAKSVSSQDEMDEYCQNFITRLEDVYPHLHIDISEYESHLQGFFTPIYKFFVRSASHIMYVFIREYIFSPKNRKMLVSEYTNTKMPNYPKEQYGKKEFYILITKLPQIIADIFSDGVKLKKFIEYVDKGSDGPVYLDALLDDIENGYIVDNGVVRDMWKRYRDTDQFRMDMTKLEMAITKNLIMPYLEENNMLSIRLPHVEPITDETADEDSDDE